MPESFCLPLKNKKTRLGSIVQLDKIPGHWHQVAVRFRRDNDIITITKLIGIRSSISFEAFITEVKIKLAITIASISVQIAVQIRPTAQVYVLRKSFRFFVNKVIISSTSILHSHEIIPNVSFSFGKSISNRRLSWTNTR